MSDEFPLVSIIIPVYNGANYMRRAIDSALNQTYQNIEVIVVNDGSNDDGETERIALSYGDKIRYFKKENGGVSTALNAGIKAMRGEYFSWLSHDDEYGPRKIELQVEQVRRFPKEKLLVLCGTEQINERSERIKELKRVETFLPGQIISWKEGLTYLFRYSCFCGCALLIPKQALEQCGLFHEGLRFSQDYLMWLKIFLKGYSLVYINDIQTYSRIHSKQLTNTGQDIFHRDSEVITDILLPEITEISTKEENFLYLFACNNARYKNKNAVKKCISTGREKKLFGPAQILKITSVCLYGVVRPTIRKIYYKVYKRV